MKKAILSLALIFITITSWAQQHYPDATNIEKKMQLREQLMQDQTQNSTLQLISEQHLKELNDRLNGTMSPQMNPQTAQVLSWDNGEINTAIGANATLTLDAAIRFEPADLVNYSGYALTAIQFYPFDEFDVTLKVWQGTSNGTIEIYSQAVNSIVIGEFNTIPLDIPVEIDVTKDLYIGYSAFIEGGFFPLTVDSGPAIPFKGDLVRFEGTDWFSMSDSYFIDMNWIIRGLAEIPADPQSPAAPLNLTLTPAAQGGLSASLNWVNPDLTFGGDVLTQLDAIVIERNNEVIATIENPVIGQPLSFEDNGVPQSGNFRYKVYGTNSFGNGGVTAITGFIGEDIPSAPMNAQLEVIENSGFISWEAPQDGINGGYINADNIVYSLKRYPDNVLVAENISALSFLDDQIPGAGNYFYEITASNPQGVGGTAVTNVSILGAEGLLMFEKFDYTQGVIPPGWSIQGSQARWRVSPAANAGGEPNELELFWSPSVTGTSRLVTYPISTGEQDLYRFRFKQRFDSFVGAGSSEKIAIDISFDGGSSWNTLWEFMAQQDIPAAEFQLPVVIPEGIQTMHLGFRFEGNTFNIDGWFLDDMIIEPVLENDLAGKSIEGPTTLSEGIPSTFVVTVQNAGSLPQTGYSVQLLKNDGVEIASVNGNPIAAGDTQTYEFVWTPQASDVGEVTLYGFVASANDGFQLNNTTNMLYAGVFPEGVVPVTISNGGNYVASSPYDFFWDHSLTQTLYYPEEIGFAAGNIFAVAYTNSFVSEVLNQPIKIWMGETDQDNLSNGWVDPASLQLVFDGTVDFPAGQNQILINLDAPYFYSGNNLVVYSSKADDNWSSSQYFINSLDTDLRLRQLKAVRDFTPFDPLNPPTPQELWQAYPDITLFMNLSGIASLQGTVTDGTEVLQAVEVSLSNTSQSTSTNAAGQYAFPALLPDTYNVTFTLIGYETLTIENVVLDEDQNVTLDAVLTALPAYTLTGIVQGNDGNLISDAEVTLSGYSNYGVLTDANGMFTIENVYASVYNLDVSAFGYTSYTLENININGNTDVGTILLQEQIEAPFNLMVMKDGLEPGQALFSWNNPLTGWAEGFESGSLPQEWSQIITNTGTNAGLPATWTVTGPVNIYNTTINPQEGDYQIFMMWDFQEQNEWLITREFTVPAGELKFWHYGSTGSVFGDSYFVKISTDNGASWDILWNASDLPPGQNHYEEAVIIDLNMYAGQKARIAWHSDDGPANFGMWYFWAIDNITIGDAAINPEELMTVSNPENDAMAMQPLVRHYDTPYSPDARDLNGFNIYLDGLLVAESVNETQYLFDGLNDGVYTAGVQAVFTTGVSDIAEISFVVDDARLLVLVANPAGSGTLLGSAWYQPGAEVLVKATAEEGFAFVSWTTPNGTIISEQSTFFFNMPDDDVILVANFEAFQTFNLTFNIDMTGNQNFIPGDDMVNITGSMHSWNILGMMARDQAMMRLDNSMNFTISMQLPPGVYSYAYFTNEGEDDIDWENIPNRSIELNEDKVVYDSWGLILGLDNNVLSETSVYPNPFTDRIELSNADWVQWVEISNVFGKTIERTRLSRNVVSTVDLTPGIYLIRLIGDNGKALTKKMIKQ